MEATYSDPWYSVKYNVGYMRHCHLCRGEFTVGLDDFHMTNIGGPSAQFLHIDVQSLLLKETNTYTMASLTLSRCRIFIMIQGDAF